MGGNSVWKTFFRLLHMTKWWFCHIHNLSSLSADQPQPLQRPRMGFPRRDQIDPRCLYTAVSQYICKLHDVLTYFIKRPRKQMPQIVRKYLPRWNPGLLTQFLHLSPDLTSFQTLSTPCNEDLSRPDLLLLGIVHQFFTQLPRQQDRTDLSL